MNKTELKKIKRAIKLMENALKGNGDYGTILYAIGEIESVTGKYDKEIIK